MLHKLLVVHSDWHTILIDHHVSPVLIWTTCWLFPKICCHSAICQLPQIPLCMAAAIDAIGARLNIVGLVIDFRGELEAIKFLLALVLLSIIVLLRVYTAVFDTILLIYIVVA